MLNVIIWLVFLLVFRRKDLCDARVKSEMSSYFQMKCTSNSSLPPGTDIWWPRAQLSHLQMMCTEELKFTLNSDI